jgi:hypothetical protein
LVDEEAIDWDLIELALSVLLEGADANVADALSCREVSRDYVRLRSWTLDGVRALDEITLQALTSGHATLPHTSIPTGLWLRLLRTILDELNTTVATAGVEHRVLRTVWQAVELPVRVGARIAQPFEDMNFTHQAQFLHAAAEAIALVRTHKLDTKGRDVSLLGEPPMPRARRPTKRSRSTLSSTSDPLLQPTDSWREARETAEGIAIPQ